MTATESTSFAASSEPGGSSAAGIAAGAGTPVATYKVGTTVTLLEGIKLQFPEAKITQVIGATTLGGGQACGGRGGFERSPRWRRRSGPDGDAKPDAASRPPRAAPHPIRAAAPPPPRAPPPPSPSEPASSSAATAMRRCFFGLAPNHRDHRLRFFFRFGDAPPPSPSSAGGPGASSSSSSSSSSLLSARASVVGSKSSAESSASSASAAQIHSPARSRPLPILISVSSRAPATSAARSSPGLSAPSGICVRIS